jgi:predicted acyl esterase
MEAEWPLARTRWTKLYIHPQEGALRDHPPSVSSEVSYATMGNGVSFFSSPLKEEIEITGPAACRLKVSSSTTDADIFVVLRVFTEDMREVTFQGAIDPHTPIAQGWLRASHRKLDPVLSEPYRPLHTHDERQPLIPGKAETLDLEIVPTSIVVPAGYRICLTVRGRDYEFAAATGARLSNFKNELKGCGPFLHDEPRDRPPEIFDASVSVHAEANDMDATYLLLPIIRSHS